MDRKSLINLVNICGMMKDLKRRGWIYKNIELPESDADHSFGVAFFAMLLTPSHLDLLKSIKMALVHDLAEVYAGDITPYDDIDPTKKRENEISAIKNVSKQLKCLELEHLFIEFEKQETPEAKWVKALDRLEAVMTAKYYDDTGRSSESLVDEFVTYANQVISKIESNDVGEILKFLKYIK